MNIKTILAVIAILSALAWVSNASYEDEQRDFALYCEHVFGPNPIWPDYKNVGPVACQKAAQ
jgi:hypothetical protein|tara:strand:+ start:1794 stop:1979 length:186 start_codon:yes stop_codon:yes gene_type:complete